MALCLSLAAAASTFTVTNTNDSGAGSLRQAILSANGRTQDTIVFNIPGGGVKTIAPLTNLDVVGGGIVIDGTTQPGWTVGNLVIEISGVNLSGLGGRGLSLTSMPAAAVSVVRGLVINRCLGSGLYTRRM